MHCKTKNESMLLKLVRNGELCRVCRFLETYEDGYNHCAKRDICPNEPIGNCEFFDMETTS